MLRGIAPAAGAIDLSETRRVAPAGSLQPNFFQRKPFRRAIHDVQRESTSEETLSAASDLFRFARRDRKPGLAGLPTIRCRWSGPSARSRGRGRPWPRRPPRPRCTPDPQAGSASWSCHLPTRGPDHRFGERPHDHRGTRFRQWATGSRRYRSRLSHNPRWRTEPGTPVLRERRPPAPPSPTRPCDTRCTIDPPWPASPPRAT